MEDSDSCIVSYLRAIDDEVEIHASEIQDKEETGYHSEAYVLEEK